jgi:hypothetical protein
VGDELEKAKFSHRSQMIYESYIHCGLGMAKTMFQICAVQRIHVGQGELAWQQHMIVGGKWEINIISRFKLIMINELQERDLCRLVLSYHTTWQTQALKSKTYLFGFGLDPFGPMRTGSLILFRLRTPNWTMGLVWQTLQTLDWTWVQFRGGSGSNLGSGLDHGNTTSVVQHIETQGKEHCKVPKVCYIAV